MFDSHCVDSYNQDPLKNPNSGTARLFKCQPIKSLASLLLNNRPQDSQHWAIYNTTLKLCLASPKDFAIHRSI